MERITNLLRRPVLTDATITEQVEYRPIAGYPGYRVGSDGTVWSAWKSAGRLKPRYISETWKQLNPAANPRHGYLQLTLYVGGKAHQKRLSRLICEVFHGEPPAGLEACHNDGNKLNNSVKNLRWGTKKSNQADRILHGTTNRGERHGNARLSEEQVRQVRNLRGLGWTYQKIAEHMGIHQTMAYKIANRITWSHVV